MDNPLSAVALAKAHLIERIIWTTRGSRELRAMLERMTLDELIQYMRQH